MGMPGAEEGANRMGIKRRNAIKMLAVVGVASTAGCGGGGAAGPSTSTIQDDEVATEEDDSHTTDQRDDELGEKTDTDGLTKTTQRNQEPKSTSGGTELTTLRGRFFANSISPNNIGEYVEGNGVMPDSAISENKQYRRSDPIIKELGLTEDIRAFRRDQVDNWILLIDKDPDELDNWANSNFDQSSNPDEETPSNWEYRKQEKLEVNDAEVDTYVGIAKDRPLAILNWDLRSTVNDHLAVINTAARTWEEEIKSYQETHQDTWVMIYNALEKAKNKGEIINGEVNVGSQENPVELAETFLAYLTLNYEDGTSFSYGITLEGEILEYEN